MTTPLPSDTFPRSIHTQRLKLRRPLPGDESLCAQLAFDAYLTRPKPLSKQRAGTLGAFVVAHWERYGFGFMLIDTVDNGTAASTIGHAGFRYADASHGHWAESYSDIELGFLCIPQARGCGYVTEASRALIAAAAQAFNRGRITARCDRDNDKSAKVLLRCGMSEIEATEKHRRFEIVDAVRIRRRAVPPG